MLTDWSEVTGVAAVKTIHPSLKDEDRSDLSLDDLQDFSSHDLRVEPLHGALIYGNWWHEAMLHADWSSGKVADELRSRVDKLPSAELCERGREQIGQFLRSDLFRSLTSPGVGFHRELAYTRMPAKDAIEDGKIDLLYRSGRGGWSLLDWKTDSVGDAGGARKIARDRYSAQIAAYVAALRDFGISVERAGIYFTAIGEWIALQE